MAKNQNGPRTSLMGPGGDVWGKKPTTKNLMRLSLQWNQKKLFDEKTD